MNLTLLPTEIGQSAWVVFTVGLLGVYKGYATRQNESDSWIVTDCKTVLLDIPLDPPVIYMHSGLLDNLL